MALTWRCRLWCAYTSDSEIAKGCELTHSCSERNVMLTSRLPKMPNRLCITTREFCLRTSFDIREQIGKVLMQIQALACQDTIETNYYLRQLWMRNGGRILTEISKKLWNQTWAFGECEIKDGRRMKFLTRNIWVKIIPSRKRKRMACSRALDRQGIKMKTNK